MFDRFTKKIPDKDSIQNNNSTYGSNSHIYNNEGDVYVGVDPHYIDLDEIFLTIEENYSLRVNSFLRKQENEMYCVLDEDEMYWKLDEDEDEDEDEDKDEDKDGMYWKLEDDEERYWKFHKLINDSLIQEFLYGVSWKSEFHKRIAKLSFQNIESLGISKEVQRLIQLCNKQLPYRDFEYQARKYLDVIYKSVPQLLMNTGIIEAIKNLYRELDKSNRKILLITGESGTGKTYLFNTILGCYEVHNNRYILNVPIILDSMETNDLEKIILNSINRYTHCNFFSLSHINKFIEEAQKEFRIININLMIDDFQKPCMIPGFYKEFKKFVEQNTQYDWIQWLININEFDLYLIIDNTDFLRTYCFFTKSSYGINDSFNVFANMNFFNNKYQTCKKILHSYNIKSNLVDNIFIDSLNCSLNSINMLLNNPLVTHIYGKTIKSDKELLNIYYFDFIIRYSEIKKGEMIRSSKRLLPSEMEIEYQINKELKRIIEYLSVHKKMIFIEAEYDFLIADFEELIFELLSAHLVKKISINTKDEYQEYKVSKKLGLKFVFNLFWAYKISVNNLYRNVTQYKPLGESFPDLRDELLSYEILLLDNKAKNDNNLEVNEALDQAINYGLIKKDDKGTVFFIGPKTSFKCQSKIFNILLNEQNCSTFTRRELYSLMYFLTYTSNNIPKKCIILSKYFDMISEYDLGFYLDGSLRRILEPIQNLTKFKRCLSQFITCTSLELCRILGRIASECFNALTIKCSLEETLHQLICFIYDNATNIVSSYQLSSDKGKNNASTFVEYFLRFLFKQIICTSKDKFHLHNIMFEKGYYFNKKYKIISHMIRGSIAIEYGNYYWSQNKNYYLISTKDILNFNKQYREVIKKLINTGINRYKIMAFHFISNTLFDDRNNKQVLDKDFIPFLSEIYCDNNFCLDRKEFFERNISYYKRSN